MFGYFIAGAVASDVGIVWATWECVHAPDDWFGFLMLFVFVGSAIVCAVTGALYFYTERTRRL